MNVPLIVLGWFYVKIFGVNKKFKFRSFAQVPSKHKVELINCADFGIEDLSWVSDFKNIQRINFSNNKIKSLDPLINCKDLYEINCSNTRHTAPRFA